jgi:hypothetical protein
VRIPAHQPRAAAEAEAILVVERGIVDRDRDVAFGKVLDADLADPGPRRALGIPLDDDRPEPHLPPPALPGASVRRGSALVKPYSCGARPASAAGLGLGFDLGRLLLEDPAGFRDQVLRDPARDDDGRGGGGPLAPEGQRTAAAAATVVVAPGVPEDLVAEARRILKEEATEVETTSEAGGG